MEYLDKDLFTKNNFIDTITNIETQKNIDDVRSFVTTMALGQNKQLSLDDLEPIFARWDQQVKGKLDPETKTFFHDKENNRILAAEDVKV